METSLVLREHSANSCTTPLPKQMSQARSVIPRAEPFPMWGGMARPGALHTVPRSAGQEAGGLAIVRRAEALQAPTLLRVG